MAYLNDKTKFDNLAGLLKEIWKNEQGIDKKKGAESTTPSGFASVGQGSSRSQIMPKSLSSIQSEYIIKMVLESHLSPNMIPYLDFKDDFLKNAFEKQVNTQISCLMQFYFIA